MRVNVTLLVLAAVSMLMLSVTFLRAKKTPYAPAAMPTREDLKAGVNRPSSANRGENLKAPAAEKSLSDEAPTSEAKADWIEDALASEDPEVNAEGERFLREMVSSGSVSDVLAALPKATFFSEETARSVAALQSTLCRFQDTDDLAFEMIKLKFNLVFRNQAEIKPWSTLCRAG
jgi:hypothetical protein